jgi:hypothetical protein
MIKALCAEGDGSLLDLVAVKLQRGSYGQITKQAHLRLHSSWSRLDARSGMTTVATMEKITGMAGPHTLQRATVATSLPHGRGGRPYGVVRDVVGLQPR